MVSPNKTELARSLQESTDKDVTSSFAADETQNQHRQQPHYSSIQHPKSPVPVDNTDPFAPLREKLYTQQTGGGHTTSNGDATEYLTNTAVARQNEKFHGNDVGVQSNSDNIETRGRGTGINTAVSPEVPKVTMTTEIKTTDLNHLDSPTAKGKNAPTPVKFPREGKTVPAVDFMSMNKTMINFSNQRQSQQNAIDQSVLEENKDGSISGVKINPPKLKQSGAFRHTEYAKGFYKVGTTNTNAHHTYATNDSVSRSSFVGDQNTIGYSEAERSNVLENQSRKPLGSKIFGQNKKGSGSQTRNIPQIIESDVSRFNSTQDTAWYKNNKRGMEGKMMPPSNKYSLNNKRTGKQGHFDGGVQMGDPMMSFGRAIGPGGSLQPKIGSRNKQQFKTLDPTRRRAKETVLSEGGGSVSKHQQHDNQMPSIVTHDIDHKSAGASFISGQQDLLSQSTRNIRGQRQQIGGGLQRRNNSVVTTPVDSIGMQGGYDGNYGHPVHLACPKDFTLTPVDKLEAMGYDMNMLPRDMHITSKKEQTDVGLVRQHLRRQRFDHLNYDPFVNTKDGQALYTGVLKEKQDENGRAIVELSDDEEEPKNLYAYLIKNGLIKRAKKKRGDPIDMMPTRRDFAKRPKADSVDVVRKAKPFNKIKELKTIFQRNDIPSIPIAKINSRINEYTNRQNTKEYLSSWLHQRRCIDKKLDEGFHVVVNDGTEDDPLHFLRNKDYHAKANNLQSGMLLAGEDVLADGDMPASNEIDVLSHVPSQKLSVLIKRKNNAIKKEKRRKEKEEMLSQMEQQEREEEENQILQILKLESAGNQSERTIQAIKNTSQMILTNEKAQNNLNGRSYPPWMVNSQATKPGQQFGTSRVVTRKLNQIVQNPPSMASMGLKNTILANLSKKSKSQRREGRKQKKQHMSMVTTSFPQQTQYTDNQNYQQTVNTTAYNADMNEVQNAHKSGENVMRHQSPDSQTEDGPTDIMTFTMQGTENKAQFSRQKTDQVDKSQSAMKLDEPSYFELAQKPNTSGNGAEDHTYQQEPPAAKSPQKLNRKQMEQADEILMKTSPNGKAIQILQRHWQLNQPGNDGAESIFSLEVPQQPQPHALSREAVMKLVSSDQTITIKDQEQMMDQISNYSISQIELPPNITNVDKKYYECITQICNFNERIPSDMIKQKTQKMSPTQSQIPTNPSQQRSSLFRPVSQRQQHQNQEERSSSQRTTPLEGQADNVADLNQTDLDVVVERVDHVTSDSIINAGKGGLKGVSHQQVDQITNDMRSDMMSDQVGKEGQSVAGYDMLSSLRNTQITGLDPSSLSKGSRAKNKILSLLKMLMDRIKEEQEQSNPVDAATTTNTGGPQAELVAPETVGQTCFYQPNQQLENFLLEKLAQVLELREDTKTIEENIDDFLQFKEFNDNENIMEKLESMKRQMAVNHELFETKEACNKFNEEKIRQTITSKEQRADLSIWNYDPKSKTRAFSLDSKMVRKEPLDMGVNSRDPSQPIPEPVDSRIAPYDAHTHFQKMVKQYKIQAKQLGQEPTRKKRPKPTSNNLKLDQLGGEERKYLVITLQELLKLN